jgi:hypothetical protein
MGVRGKRGRLKLKGDGRKTKENLRNRFADGRTIGNVYGRKRNE